MSELKPKPCPFCGAKNIGIRRGYDDITFINCGQCGAVTSFRWAEPEHLAVRQWNRRSGDATESAELHVTRPGMAE